MFLRTLEIYVLICINLIHQNFCTTSSFKKTKVKWDLLTDIGMLLMVEKGIKGGICHSIYRYAKANNK